LSRQAKLLLQKHIELVRVELPNVPQQVLVDAFVPSPTFDGRVLSFDFFLDIGLESDRIQVHLDL
tara:strand:- start:590 stop:784 length:195 start_codon:yes stop_codon:yes gene_type:complete